MASIFRIWDIVYFFYFITGFFLLYRFSQKSTSLKKEVNHFEGVLLFVLWPILYPIYMRRLKKTSKGE